VISKLNSVAGWLNSFTPFRLRNRSPQFHCIGNGFVGQVGVYSPRCRRSSALFLESEGGSFGYWPSLEHPMPRFVDKAVRVIAGIWHHKPEFFGIGSEPAECRRVFEVFGQGDHFFWLPTWPPSEVGVAPRPLYPRLGRQTIYARSFLKPDPVMVNRCAAVRD
jgi:hypothetical protein